jgi:hypothetical protein
MDEDKAESEVLVRRDRSPMEIELEELSDCNDRMVSLLNDLVVKLYPICPLRTEDADVAVDPVRPAAGSSPTVQSVYDEWRRLESACDNLASIMDSIEV